MPAKGKRPPWLEQSQADKKWARSLGSHPFLTVSKQYLRAMEGVLADSTHREMARRLRRMNKVLELMKEQGKIQSTNPYKLTDLDVLAYIGHLRAGGMRDGGIGHNIDGLANVLRFIGNAAVDQARCKYKQHFPKGQSRLDPLTENHREKIIEAAMKVPTSKWRLMEAYGLVVLAICTGLRPKELKHAVVTDLDLRRQELRTQKVKGNQRYGEPRSTHIQPDGIPFLKKYLEVRSATLERRYLVTDVLFPAMQSLERGKECVLGDNGTSALRHLVWEDVAFKFDLRICRRTFGQVSIDRGVSTESVSRMMGHANTRTTEAYYARKRNDKAIDESRKIWSTSKLNPVIECDFDKLDMHDESRWKMPDPKDANFRDRFHLAG